MKSNQALHRDRNTDLFLDILFPLIFLLITLGIDYLVPFTTLTPLMGLAGLMVFSFRLKPGWMVFWGIIYAFLVCLIFLDIRFYKVMGFGGFSQDPVTPWVRSASFILGAWLCCFVSFSLLKLKRTNDSLILLMDEIKSPVITSDLNGDIVFKNRSFKKIFKENDFKGNYFDLLGKNSEQGNMIAKYLQFFDGTNRTEYLTLDIEGVRFKGSLKVLDVSLQRILMTILEPEVPDNQQKVSGG